MVHPEAISVRAIVLALLLLAPLVPGAAAATFNVSAFNFFWSPALVEIAPGDSVTFGIGGGFHTWVRDDGTDSCSSLPCTRTFSAPATIAYHCGVHPSMLGTIQVGPGLAVSFTAPAPGSTVAGLVHVTGTASHPSDPVTGVLVRFDTGTFVAATLVGSGTSVTWSADVDSIAISEGPHAIVARASTSSGLHSEARLDVVVDNPDRLDLQVTSVSSPSGSLSTTSSVTFTTRNDGNVPSGAFRARAEYLYQGEWILIAETTIPSIAAGASRTSSMGWNPDGVLVGRFDLRVTADPGALLPDVDRANNVRLGAGGWVTSAVPGVDLLDPT